MPQIGDTITIKYNATTIFAGTCQELEYVVDRRYSLRVKVTCADWGCSLTAT